MSTAQLIILALDLVVTTLWMIALCVASLALWNAAREFKEARTQITRIHIFQGKKYEKDKTQE